MTEPTLPPELGKDATAETEADVDRVKNISTRLAERLNAARARATGSGGGHGAPPAVAVNGSNVTGEGGGSARNGSTSPKQAAFTPTAIAFTRAVSQAGGNITRNAGQASARARQQPGRTLPGVGATLAVVVLGWLTWRAARSGPPTHQR